MNQSINFTDSFLEGNNLKVRFRPTVVRLICIVLFITFLISIIPAISFPAEAYSDVLTLPSLTGEKAKDVVNIALSQLGYRESANGATAFGAWWTSETGGSYNYTYSGWCAMFACWCANQAGAGMSIAYDFDSASPDNLFSWLRRNAWTDVTYSTNPQPGDFIFFGYGSYVDHVAIVVEYDNHTNLVRFVGGNQSDGVTVSVIEWSTRGRYGSQSIVGYGRPNYGSKVSLPAKPVVSVDRDAYFSGTNVELSWKKVAGSARYQVEIYCDGILVERGNTVSSTNYNYCVSSAGEYTVFVTAENCAGSSAAGSYSFTVIDSVPQIPVWLNNSTVKAAENSAKLKGIQHFSTWYTQGEWYTFILTQ